MVPAMSQTRIHGRVRQGVDLCSVGTAQPFRVATNRDIPPASCVVSPLGRTFEDVWRIADLQVR